MTISAGWSDKVRDLLCPQLVDSLTSLYTSSLLKNSWRQEQSRCLTAVKRLFLIVSFLLVDEMPPKKDPSHKLTLKSSFGWALAVQQSKLIQTAVAKQEKCNAYCAHKKHFGTYFNWYSFTSLKVTPGAEGPCNLTFLNVIWLFLSSSKPLKSWPKNCTLGCNDICA